MFRIVETNGAFGSPHFDRQLTAKSFQAVLLPEPPRILSIRSAASLTIPRVAILEAHDALAEAAAETSTQPAS